MGKSIFNNESCNKYYTLFMIKNLIELIFPNICAGCNKVIPSTQYSICFSCLNSLSPDPFYNNYDSKVEQIFWGRIPFKKAIAYYNLQKESNLRNMLHALKYKQNKEVGIMLGKIIAHTLLKENIYTNIDYFVPIPIHNKKLKLRGYNQAFVLAQAIAEVYNKSAIDNILLKEKFTQSQTTKTREERVKNVQDTFSVNNMELFENKNICIVDDVLTTGATVEAAANVLMEVKNISLNLVTVAHAI
jgi:competence protein ComFC